MSLRVYLLGQFHLQVNDRSLELPSRAAQSLLAYLALNAGISQRREKLSGLLWPEATSSNARSYLRQALWRIRKTLNEAAVEWQDYLQVNDIAITFNDQSPYWLDAAQLLKPIEKQTVDDLSAALALYRGELLPGFYDDWVVIERDRLLAAYQQKMNLLLERLLAGSQFDEVVRWGEQWIRLDFAPEPAYRALMIAQAGLGNQGMVGATYQRCQEALQRELGVEPSPETQHLYEEIRRREVGELEQKPTVLPTGRLPAFLKEGAVQAPDQPIFVAREYELDQLHEYLDRALQGHGQVIFITGEAGGGKTALLGEFSRRAQQTNDDLVVANGNCNAHTGIGDPYLPFREILEQLTGDVESRWDAGTMSRDHALRLWRMLPLAGQALVYHAPNLIDTFLPGNALLARAASATPAEAPWLARLRELKERKIVGGIIQGPQQDDLFEQMTKLLQALAREVPLVLMVDDLQWADLGSISLIFHLGRSLHGSRILLIGAYRPEEVALGRDGRQHPLEAVVNELGRDFGNIQINMDEAENRDFMEAILDSELNCLDVSFRDMLYRQTRGNPLFTIELLRGMQVRGDLVQDETGQWIEGPQLAWEMLPARVESVIAQRIGRLDPGLQAALRTACVEGEHFTAEVVAEIRDIGELTMLECLSSELDRKHRLVTAHSIERRGDQRLSRYRFRHIQIQQYLYSSLDEVERNYMHERVGVVLEMFYGDEEWRAAHSVQLARHFQEAQILEKAVRYRFLAGQHALDLTAFEEAINHLTKGLDLLNSLPDSRQRAVLELDMQLALGMAWMSTGNPTREMEEAYDRARQLSRQIGETRKLGAALGGLAIVNYVRANHSQALAYAHEALALAEEEQDPLQLMLAHWYSAFINFAMGEYSNSQKHTREVAAIYDPEQHHHALVHLRGVDPGVGALAYEACCLWCLGYPERSMALREKALRLACQLNHAFTLSDVICYAGCSLDALCRDGRSLQQHAEELIRLADKIGMPGWLKMATCFRGEALVLLGQHEEGMAILEKGIASRSSMHEQINAPGRLCALAGAYFTLGKIEESKRRLAEAVQIMEESGEWHWRMETFPLQAELHLAEGHEENAQASLQDAIKIAQEKGAKSWELSSSIILARLWQKQGRVKEARDLLGRIYGWFTEGFATAGLQEAKALLDELHQEQ